MWVRLSSVEETTCKDCDLAITWVENIENGKRIPINGHDILFESTDAVPDAGWIDLRHPRVSGPGYVSHWATCKASARRRVAPRARAVTSQLRFRWDRGDED